MVYKDMNPLFILKSPWHFYFICNKFRRSSAGVTVLKILFIKVQGIGLIFNKKRNCYTNKILCECSLFFHKLLFPFYSHIGLLSSPFWSDNNRNTCHLRSFYSLICRSKLCILSSNPLTVLSAASKIDGLICRVCLVLNDLQDEKWLTSRAKGIEKEIGGDYDYKGSKPPLC